jgi:hypothetical protein
MLYRLLVDYEVLEFVSTLKKPVQRAIYQRLRAIQNDPAGHSDYQQKDRTGRPLHVHICAGHALTYWEDFADRHVKILGITKAD